MPKIDDNSLNAIAYSLPAGIAEAVNKVADVWTRTNLIDRVWARDAAVWTGEDEGKWLGWLDIIDDELNDLKKYRALADDIRRSRFNQVLLMGMGGSSLCPEVLANTFGKVQFQILDSTVPAQVKSIEDSLDLEKTLFIVASKSGSTLEPNCFKQYFFERLALRVGRENAGRQFIAITDPGSKMEAVARRDGFRHIFYGKPEIGGRFSALSAFGLVPAVAMEMEVEYFWKSARNMAKACKVKTALDNPGAMLGITLGVCHAQGRDKLTIIASDRLRYVGGWLEQLIAESTGKDGVAIIPVDREPAANPEDYSNDRVFLFLGLSDDHDTFSQYETMAATGRPAIRVKLDRIEDLGQEFFRWEFATAVAGAVMRINPFNQPDVEAAKIEARKLTDRYERTGSLAPEHAFFTENGISLFSGDEYISDLKRKLEHESLAGYLKSHIAHIAENDYFALLAYVEMNEGNQAILAGIREKVLSATGAATCLGFGPRFLHSTGQAYKGGADNGVFLQVTSDDEFDLPVPGQKYSFGVVKAAQSRGDFQVLLDRGRRALRVHLGSQVANDLTRLSELLS
jgi:transaldolase/glucose-6-phosphate isomerase